MARRLKFHVPVPLLGQHLAPRLLRPVAWRPLTDGEWDVVRPFVMSLHSRGRPVADMRARLDACLHGACMAGPWKELPEQFGKPDTVSRQFRRWAEAQLCGRYERVAGAVVARAPQRIGQVRVKAQAWLALDQTVRAAGLPCEALCDGIAVEDLYAR